MKKTVLFMLILLVTASVFSSCIFFGNDRYIGEDTYQNKRWVCQEVDMYFDTVEISVPGVHGSFYEGAYTTDGTSYRLEFLLGLMPRENCFDLRLRNHRYTAVENDYYLSLDKYLTAPLRGEIVEEDGKYIMKCTILDTKEPADIWTYEGDTLTFVMEELPEDYEYPKYEESHADDAS